jgi:hypothetical protein
MNYIQEHQARGEIVTGLLYVEYFPHRESITKLAS